jgi:hypothetical protein
MIKSTISVVVLVTVYTTLIHAEGTCTISEQKRAQIKALLCGQQAPNLDYQLSGPNCVVRSAEQRIGEAAVQIHSFELCGEHEFAKRLKETNIQSYKVSQTLSVCTSERFDAAKLIEDGLKQAADKAAALRMTCNSEVRRLLESRRAILEKMINQITTQPNLAYDRLGLAVDGDGNIRDK